MITIQNPFTPIVYVLWGKSECLYVGESYRGLTRFNLTHPVIREHGEEVTHVELHHVIGGRSERLELERKLTKELRPKYDKSHLRKHNLTKEAKRKIGEAKRGANNPSFAAAGESHWNRGLVRSPETRAKIRAARATQVMKKLDFCKRAHKIAIFGRDNNGTCRECKRLSRRDI